MQNSSCALQRCQQTSGMQRAGAAPAPRGQREVMQVLQLSSTKLEQWNREGQCEFALSERDRDGAGTGQMSSFHKMCTDCNGQMLPAGWIMQIFVFRGPESSPEVRGVSAPPLQCWPAVCPSLPGCSVRAQPACAPSISCSDKLNLINRKINDIDNSSMDFFPVYFSLATLPPRT